MVKDFGNSGIFIYDEIRKRELRWGVLSQPEIYKRVHISHRHSNPISTTATTATPLRNGLIIPPNVSATDGRFLYGINDD